ncbi:MAG: hypothetical protein AMXMBFR53_21010 [Gemmatimonadota bacterium]
MSAPRWAVRLLEWGVPEPWRETAVGDLIEAHERRRAHRGPSVAWLLTTLEAVTVAASFAPARLREGRAGRVPLLTGTEVRLAARLLRRYPLMNLTAGLALATGLTLATAAFSFARSALFADLPWEGGDRFVMVRFYDDEGDPKRIDGEGMRVLADGVGAFAWVGAIRGDVENVHYEDGDVEGLESTWISPSAFAYLPYAPLLGRTLVPADGAPGAPPVVLLRETLWRDRFGGDPTVLGRTLEIAGVRRVVVGVMPAAAEFPNRGDAWLPLSEDLLGTEDGPGVRGATVFAIVEPGATLVVATAQASAVVAGLERDAEDVRTAAVSPFTRPPESALIFTLFGGLLASLALVLAVVAANVGHLMAARTAARTGELAVRAALGASRGRLVAQLVLEVGVLATLAAGFALVTADAFLRWLGGVVDDIPFWIHFGVDTAGVAFLGGMTLLVTAVAGGLPAWRATRREVAHALRRSAHRGASLPVPGGLLASLEMATSVALIGAAFVTLRGFSGYARPDLDVPSPQVVTAYLAPTPEVTLPAAAVLASVVEEARRIPGVRAAGVATAVPGVDPPAPLVEAEGRGTPAARAPVVLAGPGFLESLGTRPVAGRLITEEDLLPGALPVAVVNEPFVAAFLGGGQPLGARVRVVDGRDPGAAPEWREVVGVVPDLGLSLGDPALAAGLYLPLTEVQGGVYLTVHVEGDPAAYGRPLRQAAAATGHDVILANLSTLADVGSDNVVALGVISGALTLLGAGALVLSIASLYAISSFTVTRRTREIGVRIALGASGTEVVRSVVGRTALFLAAGAAAGTVLGGAILRVRSIFVFRVPSGEPWLLPAIAVLLCVVGALASWVPARRAASIHPVEALRTE